MSTEHSIELARPNPLAPTSLSEVKELATIAYRSGLLPEAVASPEAAFIIIANGFELGISPMQALRGIHVINGKPILSADLMVALVLRSPLCAYFQLQESDATRATWVTERRGGNGPVDLTWTIQDAQRAKLTEKGTWKGHPAAMLRARCAAALARAVYPDLLLGVYEQDEGDEIRAGRTPAATPPEPVASLRPTVDVLPAPLPPAPAGLKAKFLADVAKATTEEELRHAVKGASGAKKAGHLVEADFQAVADAAQAKHEALFPMPQEDIDADPPSAPTSSETSAPSATDSAPASSSPSPTPDSSTSSKASTTPVGSLSSDDPKAGKSLSSLERPTPPVETPEQEAMEEELRLVVQEVKDFKAYGEARTQIVRSAQLVELSGEGVMRLYRALCESVNRFAPPRELELAVGRWIEQAQSRRTLDGIENDLKLFELGKAMDKHAIQRLRLASAKRRPEMPTPERAKKAKEAIDNAEVVFSSAANRQGGDSR